MKPVALVIGAVLTAATWTAAAQAPKPIKVLIITGGCCHNYPKQREILENGLKQRIHADIAHAYYDPKPGEEATRPKLPILGNPDYANGFDVVLHNECAAGEDNPAALDAVLAPHRKGTPAINLHCAMHSYRSGTYQVPVKPGDANARWFEFTGIQSSGHGPQSPIQLAVAAPLHPIAKGFVPYTTPSDELYNNLTTFNVTPVLTGVQPQARNPAEREQNFTVAWTHHYGPQKVRVFSMTLAHNEAVMADARYLDLVARGVLWATAKLDDDGQALPGYALK